MEYIYYIKSEEYFESFRQPNLKTVSPKQLGMVMHLSPSLEEKTYAKIARGAFARFLITCQIVDAALFSKFSDLGYGYSRQLSTLRKPTFVCKTFEGIGLSA